MRLHKLIYAACSMTSAFSLISAIPANHILTISNPNTASLPSQALTEALSTIGAPLEDVLAFKQSGQISSGIVKAVTLYANDSSNSIFNNLSQDQSNALVLFSFTLNNQKKLSEQSIQDLMRDEKLRAGMSSQQITQLQSLTKNLMDDSSFVLTPAMVDKIKEITPFITANPFAFADTIGPVIGALIYNSENGFITPDPDLEKALTETAQQLTGLSDEQIENITNITNTYQDNNTFNSTDENVEDINQALAVATLPLGAYALYPLLGYSTVATVNEVTGVYGHYFNEAYVNHWNNVSTRQGYYNDAASTHQSNINQRQSDANNASQQRQSTVDERNSTAQSGAQQRQDTVDQRQGNTSQAESNRSGNESQRQSDASGASQNRQGNVDQRQSNVSGAENRGSTNLNRDNARGSYKGHRSGGGGGRR